MPGPAIDFSKLRVLVVENHALMRRLLHEMLRGFGVAQVREARNVPEAIERIYAERFDAVILDFFLGELDGADFAWKVRHDARCPNRHVPILLITGMPDHHKVLKVRQAGVDGMLAKPIAPRDLHDRLHALLAAPRRFVVTPDYVGPVRDRSNQVSSAPPAAARFRRLRPTEAAAPPANPALEDGILL